MISVQEAIELIEQHRPTLTMEERVLHEAHNLVLAKTIKARVSRPPGAVSAMDGYAVRLLDVQQAGAKLRVIGEAPAGSPFPGHVENGQAVRIFTGALLPAGADHIIIQEDVTRSGDHITCRSDYLVSQHIRPAGLDFTQGEILLSKGRRIDSLASAAAAAANHATLPVYQPPIISLISNGDELKAPGTSLEPGQIINSNIFGLSGLIRDWGGVPHDCGVAADNMPAITEKIRDAERAAKIIVTIGGASVGDHDHMRTAFLKAGYHMLFEKIAMKPGKPTWFAQHGDRCVLGLPGNPASALVCAKLFLQPLLHQGSEPRFVPAVLGQGIGKNGQRETYLRAQAQLTPDGKLVVSPASNQDSSLLTPFLTSNCLLKRPAGAAAIREGEIVDILPMFSSFKHS